VAGIRDQRQIESDWPASAQPPGLVLSVEQAELIRMVNALPDRPLQLRLDCRVSGLHGGPDADAFPGQPV
jgi:hypothetical protein